MTTIDDQASMAEELDRELCLKRRKVEPYHYGICPNCYEPIPKSQAYCDAECRQDGEARAKMTGKAL